MREGFVCKRITQDSLTLIVYGEVFGDDGPLTADAVLQRYQASGPQCVRELDGAFVLVAINAGDNTTVVVTDRCNGLKCFIEETSDAVYLVSSLCFLPLRQRSLDPVAIVSYLGSGSVLNGRTLLRGVRVLPRASIHRLSADGKLGSAAYWTYHFEPRERSVGELLDELSHLATDAIRRRSVPTDSVCVSLSGGFDSLYIFGTLCRLGRDRLQCFSYTYFPDAGFEGSDAMRAEGIAARFGVPHRRVSGFDGDLMRVIQRNVEAGEGRSNLCLESDAWDHVRESLPHDCIIVMGDQSFTSAKTELRSKAHVLFNSKICPSIQLEPYAALSKLSEAAITFDDETHASYVNASHPDLRDTFDALYLDQRVANVLMPWRELFAADPHRVRNPLLDRHLLDFVRCLPSSLRYNKRLFRELALRQCPEIFREWTPPRPEPNPWLAAIQRCKTAIEQELAAPSPADDWLYPEQCLSLLATATEPVPASPGGARSSPQTVAPWLLLLRVVTLRKFATAFVS